MSSEQDEHAARKLLALQRAYQTIFEGSDKKLTRAAELVMGDLFDRCWQGNSVTGQPGWRPEDLALAEGARRVYIHIAGMLRASDADLWRAAANFRQWQQQAERDPLDTPQED